MSPFFVSANFKVAWGGDQVVLSNSEDPESCFPILASGTFVQYRRGGVHAYHDPLE